MKRTIDTHPLNINYRPYCNDEQTHVDDNSRSASFKMQKFDHQQNHAAASLANIIARGVGHPHSFSHEGTIKSAAIQCEMGIECLRYLQAPTGEQQHHASGGTSADQHQSSVVDLTPDSTNICPMDLLNSLAQASASPIGHHHHHLHHKSINQTGRIINWTNQETELFLNLCIQEDVPGQMQEKCYRFSKVFCEISEKMNCVGYQRTTTQLKDKYKTLKSRYNKGDLTGLNYECLQCLDRLFGTANTSSGGLNDDDSLKLENLIEPHIEILEDKTN